MYSFVAFIWFLLLFLFMLNAQNLLLALILLEILSFFLIYSLVILSGGNLILDYIVLTLFCVFVIEGVVALSGLIILVNFVGSDYISNSSFLQL